MRAWARSVALLGGFVVIARSVALGRILALARVALVALAVLAPLAASGCATAFRESQPKVLIASDPPGAAAVVRQRQAATPLEAPVPRSGVTMVSVTKDGFAEHRGLVRKRINGWWLVADIGTCVVPVMLCIPLLVDAITGAWFDVEPTYRARLLPLGVYATPMMQSPAGDQVVIVGTNGAIAQPTAPPPPPPSSSQEEPRPSPEAPPSSMSESERKASARALYQEGIDLQAQKSFGEAAERFQSAQKIFDAPPHLLHLGECYVALGKLVEAREAFELLAHREVPKDAPEPFREAAERGKKELAELEPRIPTLRIGVFPAQSTLRQLVVVLNGRPLPNEMLGIARPVNPGTYRANASARTMRPANPVEVIVREGEAKVIELQLR